MAGNTGINRGHRFLPFIADGVKIRVTDAAEKDFNLYIVFGWIAPRDPGGGQRRSSTASGVSFHVLHINNVDVRRASRYAKSANVDAKMRQSGISIPCNLLSSAFSVASVSRIFVLVLLSI
jgi:hypothetical protein